MTNFVFFLCIGAAIIPGGQCDDCHLPPDSGSCSDLSAAKEELRYFYSATNLKCTEMPYVGCGGNSNNFKTVEECNKKCGIRLVETSMVTAILAAKKNSKCWFNNVTYSIGEKIPQDEDPCKSCSCTEKSGGLNMSASIECTSSYCYYAAGRGCRSIVKPGQCCEEVYCPGKKEPYKCEYQGRHYYEGEAIPTEDYSCMTCTCNKNWKGMLTTEGGVCVENSCLLAANHDYANKENCEPVYFINYSWKQSCCLFEWKCK